VKRRRTLRAAHAGVIRALIASLAVPVLGCAVGQGTGTVKGTLDVNQCTFDSSANPTPLTVADFDLHADFFAGQPIDADPILEPRFPANQMIIRVQHSGKRLESANALVFLIQDSAAVARCMHGAPGWDPALCDRSAAALGPGDLGRVFIGMTSETVRSFFVLNEACPKGLVSADALGTACEDNSCPDVALCPGRGSWITFADYGNVPADPAAAISFGFKVNDGERMRAQAFHVEMCDAATVLAKLDHVLPVPKPNVVGTLDGSFDFNLERGQAGQPFP
jgi:hypothetical protein